MIETKVKTFVFVCAIGFVITGLTTQMIHIGKSAEIDAMIDVANSMLRDGTLTVAQFNEIKGIILRNLEYEVVFDTLAEKGYDSFLTEVCTVLQKGTYIREIGNETSGD